MSRGRSYDYEVQVCREGRWTIEAILADEAQAVQTARMRLATGAVEEVKVVRSRTMMGGFTTKKEILNEKRPATKEPPLIVTGNADGAPLCCELEELYLLPARMVMGRLLRLFLEKFQVTPTELLHNWTYARKLADTGTLMSTALYQVAQVHAKVLDVPVKSRLSELQPLADRALARARDFAAERRRVQLPAFEAGNLATIGRRIEAELPPEEGGFFFRALLCQYLTSAGSIGAKGELALDLLMPDLDPRLAMPIEGVVADSLATADAVKDLLGPQRNLGTSLAALANFLNGRGAPAGAPTTFGRIGALIAEGRAVQCRDVLLERLLTELSRDTNPLDRGNPEGEPKLLEAVIAGLRTADGALLGGKRAQIAVARRQIRIRQDHLRRLGLHDQADAIGAEFRKLTI
ncbi:hypothetical protein [Arenibaculum pallidiluteum]|uniref:hypothetical protein n=1 Tax=Arenibaculum pallidiluteum TaxID=2812559 RepID=UPI001A97C1FF|nr:hypothetical protein [Arenibaculum pallidiluteum]